MVVKQSYDSQESHITQDGETLTLKWTALWADWAADYINLPNIGDHFGFRFDLRCTDIRADTIDNVNCTVTALYSTRGYENRQERVDEVDAWEASIETQTEEIYGETYRDVDLKERFSWATAWELFGGSDAARPYHVYYQPKTIFRITTYGSSLYIQRSYDGVGRINADNLISAYNSLKAAANPQFSADGGYTDDIGKWMLQTCNASHIRADTWRYDWSFVYSKIGWQLSEGPSATSDVIFTNEYQTFLFNDIFGGMDLIEPEFLRNTRGV